MGSSFAAFGLALLNEAGIVTGGVAGIALSISYSTGWPVGLLFVTINLPFFLLAFTRMGMLFTLKSLSTMGALAAFSLLLPSWMSLSSISPLFAATFGGSLIGMGVLSLARHNSSVGGIGMLALHLQERHGLSAGLVQMGFDGLIVLAACLTVGIDKLGQSVVSALALNLVILTYHRPGRYAGY